MNAQFTPYADAVAPPRPLFTGDQCDALFAAVLIDDDIDAHTELPLVIRSDYPPELFSECFGLCQALWHSGYRRETLIALVERLIRDRDLDAADRLRFKYVRAKFKHLRYAFTLYSEDDGYPPMFDRMTIVMGHLQDAYRNRQPGAVLRQALLLRLVLTRLPQMRLARETAQVAARSTASFRAMLEKDKAGLIALLAQERVTGAEVHAARKIVGRQVSFYDTLRTLQPSADTFRMSRSLSAIHGLMGRLHDMLVLRRTEDRGAYDQERFVLPDAIRERIAALTAVPFSANGQP
jgi:hypothetical protein